MNSISHGTRKCYLDNEKGFNIKEIPSTYSGVSLEDFTLAMGKVLLEKDSYKKVRINIGKLSLV